MRKWAIRVGILLAIVAAVVVLKATLLAPKTVPVLVAPVGFDPDTTTCLRVCRDL